MYLTPILKIEDAVLGEDVIVTKPDSQMFDCIGQIWKVKFYGNRLRISVCFEGEIYNFKLEDLAIA